MPSGQQNGGGQKNQENKDADSHKQKQVKQKSGEEGKDDSGESTSVFHEVLHKADE